LECPDLGNCLLAYFLGVSKAGGRNRVSDMLKIAIKLMKLETCGTVGIEMAVELFKQVNSIYFHFSKLIFVFSPLIIIFYFVAH